MLTYGQGEARVREAYPSVRSADADAFGGGGFAPSPSPYSSSGAYAPMIFIAVLSPSTAADMMPPA